ncbi:MAG: hypothetical protein EA358_10935 [Flavobacteriales bacterium]|nr:MAG: hypothetical protein EA358_10935 [Flavobacteriales bacterium]
MKESLQRELENLCLEILRRQYSTSEELLDASRSLYERAVILHHESTRSVADNATTVKSVSTQEEPVKTPPPIERKEAPKVEEKVQKPVSAPEPMPISQPEPTKVSAPIPEKKVEKAPVAEKAPPAEKVVVAKKSSKVESSGRQLHNALQGKELRVGLNDRIAFVKKLFHGESDDFNRVVSQINSFSNFEEADSFIQNLVAPEYGWDMEEEFSVRFMNMIRMRFGLDEMPEE